MHTIPPDLQKNILSNKSIQTAWSNITPLAKNEWICWIQSAKKTETRKNRLERACAEIQNGKRRPCCWAGCGHR